MLEWEMKTKEIMLKTGVFDASVDLIVLLLLVITFLCLLKTTSTGSTTLTKISIAYCIIVLLIIIHDMGFTFLTLWLALSPEPVQYISNYPVLFKISVMVTALKIYAKFVLIIIHLLVSINRTYAVFKPLQYAKRFSPRRTTTMILLVFILCIPVFFIYAFRLFECEYFFDPQYFSWSYTKNTCYITYVIVDYLLSGLVLSSAIGIDAVITVYLFRSRRERILQNDRINFRFMIQTLILSSANGFVTLYRHTVGIWNFFNPWIDHITKFSDIMLAFIYVMCIAFLNDAVRSEVLGLLCFRNKDTASPTIVTVCSKAPSKSSKKKKQKENTL